MVHLQSQLHSALNLLGKLKFQADSKTHESAVSK